MREKLKLTFPAYAVLIQELIFAVASHFQLRLHDYDVEVEHDLDGVTATVSLRGVDVVRTSEEATSFMVFRLANPDLRWWPVSGVMHFSRWSEDVGRRTHSYWLRLTRKEPRKGQRLTYPRIKVETRNS